jgi:hypothetical protein
MVMRFGEHQANGKSGKENCICTYQELNPITVGWIEELGFNSQQNKRFFLFSTVSKSAVRPPRFISRGYKGFFL